VQHSPDYLTNTKLIKEEVIEIAKTIYTIIAIKPTSKQLLKKYYYSMNNKKICTNYFIPTKWVSQFGRQENNLIA
jgi:hypothetical protein